MAHDLSDIATEALLTELYTRYASAVFAGLSILEDASEEAEYGYCGGTYTGAGLAVGLQAYLQRQRAYQAQASHSHGWTGGATGGEDDDGDDQSTE